ncbi:MAG: EndoU domain-containing protein [Pseudomonadales bacterium]|nr:EndoU domain-containing protein [Pseudomonadales bacterium]
MDTWAGVNAQPISLNKYLYTNGDPVNYTDPSGNFGIGAFAALSFRYGMTALTLIDIIGTVSQVASGEASPADLGKGILMSLLPTRLLKPLFKKFCNSFTEGTLVSTANGLIPIEEVSIGDYVLSYNEDTGEQQYNRVVHLIEAEGLKSLVSITLMSGEVLDATESHPFYVKKSGENWIWQDAGELEVGDILIDSEGNEILIASLENYTQTIRVFNFNVEKNHTFYVGNQSILTHNSNVCFPPSWSPKSLAHVFKGNKTGGFHHRAGGLDPANSRVLKVHKRVTNGKWSGAYETTVEICDNGKCFKKPSTFFPDSWSKTRVQGEINSAYMRFMQKTGKSSGTFVEKSANGYPIKIVVKEGEIVTAYPNL